MAGDAAATRLQQALDKLAQGEAAAAGALLRELATPVTLGCAPGALPALCTLPLAQQADLLLLLRAAPHKFPRQGAQSLLSSLQQRLGPPVGGAGGAQQPLGAALVMHLAQELQDDCGGVALEGSFSAPPLVPPCPDFLFTPAPAFPWAPRLVGPGEALPHAPPAPAAAAAAAVAGAAGPRTPAAPPAGAAAGKEEGGRKRAIEGGAGAVAAAAVGAMTAKRRRTAPGASSDVSEEEEEGEEGKMGAEGLGATSARAAAMPGAGEPIEAAAAAGPAPAAPDALPAAVAALKRGLMAAAAGSPLDPAARAALDAVLAAAGATGTAGAASSLLSQAGLASLADDSLLVIVREAVGPASTFARCSLVAGDVLLPVLRALDAPPSRALAAAIEHLGSANPQALLAACLRPLLAAPGFTQHHAELLGRAAKDWLPASLLGEVVEAACGGGAVPAAHAAPAAGAHWNEQVVGLVQGLLGARPELSQSALQALAHALAGAAAREELQPSVKLGKLMLSAVKQYGEGLRRYKGQLAAAARMTKSFMTKTVLAAVAKL